VQYVEGYKVVKFSPFNPVDKKTTSTTITPTGVCLRQPVLLLHVLQFTVCVSLCCVRHKLQFTVCVSQCCCCMCCKEQSASASVAVRHVLQQFKLETEPREQAQCPVNGEG